MSELTLETTENVEMEIETDPYIACRQAEENAKLSEDNAKLSEENVSTIEANVISIETNIIAKANEVADNASLVETLATQVEENTNIVSADKTTITALAQEVEENATTVNEKTTEASTSAEKAKTSEENAKASEDNVIALASEVNANTITITKTVEKKLAVLENKILSKSLKETVTDTLINVDDALSEVQLLNYGVKGNSTQGGTPTFEAPIDVESVGDSGSIDVRVTGKNMVDVEKASFNASRITFENGTFTFRDDRYLITNSLFFKFQTRQGYHTDKKYQHVTGIGKYTFTFTVTQDSTDWWVAMADNTNNIQTFSLFLKANIGNFIGKDVTLSYEITTFEDGLFEFKDLQIEVGDTATGYEPYEEQIVRIPVSSPLYKVSNSIQDILNVDTLNKRIWVEHKCAKYAFTGTELWTVGASDDTTNRWDSYDLLTLTSGRGIPRRGYFTNKLTTTDWEFGKEGFFTSAALNVLLFKNKANPNDYFKNGDYIIYPLETPTTEEIPWKDEYKLLAKNPMNVFCEDDVSTEVNVIYVKDSNIVLANLTEAIVALQGGV